jgi:hypothetical protein
VCEKVAQHAAQPIFVKINTQLMRGEKSSGSVIFEKLPNLNNHPMDEKSPNLVTLSAVGLSLDLFQDSREILS